MQIRERIILYLMGLTTIRQPEPILHTQKLSAIRTGRKIIPTVQRVTQDESEEFANVFDRTFVKLRSVVLEYDFSSLLNPRGMVKGFTANISALQSGDVEKIKNLYSDPDFQTKQTMIFRIHPADGLESDLILSFN